MNLRVRLLCCPEQGKLIQGTVKGAAMGSKDREAAAASGSSLVGAIIVGVLIAVIPTALGYIAFFIDGARKDELV